MKNKNIIYIIILLLIITICIVWYLFNVNIQEPQPVVQIPKENTNVPKKPEIPRFILGIVSKTEGQKVFIKIGVDEKSVLTDEKTVITKQIKEGGVFKSVSADFNEIKYPFQVVVYYGNDSSSVQYRAEKIQILVF